MRVAHIERADFIEHHWDFRPGEHVSFIEPTQQGKTYLMYQILEATIARFPELSTVTLVPKPRDPATAIWTNHLGMEEIPDWPPKKRLFRDKPPGYALWPKHKLHLPPDENREYLAGVFRKCLADQYGKGNSITVADDIYIAAVMMKLNMAFEEFWVAGGGMGASLWSLNQKPSGTIGGGSVSSFSYSAPTHLFFGPDPDERNQKRLSEIGGVDPKAVAEIVKRLPIHQVNGKNVSDKLYIHKAGFMATVGI